MRMLNEAEAAQSLGEIARERKAAGLAGLTEVQAARFLGTLRQVRSLPEMTAARPFIPQPRGRTGAGSLGGRFEGVEDLLGDAPTG
jgi:hypothetical protein